MGFFSGILDTVKDVAGGVLGAVTDPIGSIVGAGLGLIGNQQTNQGNQANSEAQMQFQADQSAINRDWQTQANQRAMDFSGAQNHAQRMFSAGQADTQFNRQWEMNQHAMDFSRDMASTQHQRAVQDLKRAGLNPMLAVTQGGAAAPSGTSGAVSAGSSGAASGVSNSPGGLSSAGSTFAYQSPLQSVASAMQASVASKQAQLLQAQASNVQADTVNKLLAPEQIGADIDLKHAQSYQSRSQGHLNIDTASKINRTVGPLIDQIKAQANQSNASASQIQSQNLAIKDLMENPATRPFAPLLQLILPALAR